MTRDADRDDKSDALTELRRRISALDHDILQLVKERLAIAEKIGREKLARSLPIQDSEIEDSVRERNKQIAASLGIPQHLAEDLTKTLISYCRDEQRKQIR